MRAALLFVLLFGGIYGSIHFLMWAAGWPVWSPVGAGIDASIRFALATVAAHSLLCSSGLFAIGITRIIIDPSSPVLPVFPMALGVFVLLLSYGP